MKIRTKIILFTCVLCIISVFLVFLINYNFTAEKLLNEIENNARNTARITAREMDKWLSIQKNSLKEIGGDALVYNDDFDHDYVYDYLSGQGNINEGNAYYVGLANDTLISGSGWIASDDYKATEKEWYIDAQNSDDVVVSSPYIDARTGDVIVTISKALKKRE